MKKNNFWIEIDSRLGENKTLSQGGVPGPLRQIAAFTGFYPWQTLLVSSGVLVLVAWLVWGTGLVRVVESVLLIK